MIESRLTEPLLEELVDYGLSRAIFSDKAYETARLCLFDTIGALLAGTKEEEAFAYSAPLFEGIHFSLGSRILGTSITTDPLTATFSNGLLLRWLDFNDTWLAKEWGHPSDNLAAILSLGDYLCQKGKPLPIKRILDILIKSYEVQGILALDNSFNELGLDHVILVKIASTFASLLLYEASRKELYSGLSHAFSDLGPLRLYRHFPNVTARKCWAAGDASARGLFLATLAVRGEQALSLPLSTPIWGLNDRFFKDQPLHLARKLESNVMENILFKIPSPTEFHAQTSLEAALQLHKEASSKLASIDKIVIETHAAALKIIVKEGPLHNPQDRDHCLQYIVAIGLLFGTLTQEHYEIETASLPEVDALRSKMVVVENPDFTRDYLNPDKRATASGLQIFYTDGTRSRKIIQEYPLGHPRRRAESRPLLLQKFRDNARNIEGVVQNIPDALALLRDPVRFDAMSLSDFISYFIPLPMI